MNKLELKAKLPSITDEQKERAIRITSIVALKIEIELDQIIFFSEELGEDIPPEIYKTIDSEYLINSQPTEFGKNLTISGVNRRLTIDMLGGELMIADGIELEDLDYWLEIESQIIQESP